MLCLMQGETKGDMPNPLSNSLSSDGLRKSFCFGEDIALEEDDEDGVIDDDDDEAEEIADTLGSKISEADLFRCFGLDVCILQSSSLAYLLQSNIDF